MSIAVTAGVVGRRRRFRRRIRDIGGGALGVFLLIWTMVPIYNMLLIALDPEEGEIEFDGNIWPPAPSLDGFLSVLTQEARYLEDFWHQFGNSIYIGLLTMVLTVLVGSLASFAVGRTWLGKGSLLSSIALVTYTLPSSFLVIPFYRMVHSFGIASSAWAVIAAQVTFATPFAILILQQYARLIPTELDEAARLDGASAVQVYLRLYLPLMAPALAAVGVYALMLAWNDYVYQFVISTAGNWTVSVTQAQLFVDVDAEWNAMMAAAILYALPPIVIFYALGRYIAAGLMVGEAAP